MMKDRIVIAACLAVLWLQPAPAAEWTQLLDKDLTQWDRVGDGVWTVMRDGTLLGQRDPKQSTHQAWLYTKKDFGEYDLHLEWWTCLGGNSGVSVRDTSRAKYAVGTDWDAQRTPSHIGYEIQISNGDADKYPSGSIYLFDRAKTGSQIDNDWNSFDIESREDIIRVKLNGQVVSQYAGEPGRPKAGPVGLQLHDSKSLAMFRNIRIREIKRKR